MKHRWLVIAFALLVASASDSWGQSKQNPPKAGQQGAAQKERGSEENPAIVKIVPTEKSKDELEAEKAKRESDKQLVKLTGELAKYTEYLFAATAFLVLATAGLVVTGFRQISDARRAIIAAETSANVAQRALTELERPYLFIMDFNWLLTTQAAAEGHRCGWTFSVANGGKLPAFIKTLKFGLTFGDSIPSIEDEPPINELLTAPLIAGGDERRVTKGLVDDDESGREYQIRNGMAFIPDIVLKERVIAKISIEYDGPTTTGHVTSACWEWHPVKHAFSQYGGPEHNERT